MKQSLFVLPRALVSAFTRHTVFDKVYPLLLKHIVADRVRCQLTTQPTQVQTLGWYEEHLFLGLATVILLKTHNAVGFEAKL